MPCDWIEFAKFKMENDNSFVLLKSGDDVITKVSFAWLLREKSEYRNVNAIQIEEDQLQEFVTPDGWKLDDAKTFHFVPTDRIPVQLKFLRTEGDLDVFWDTESQKELFKPRDS